MSSDHYNILAFLHARQYEKERIFFQRNLGYKFLPSWKRLSNARDHIDEGEVTKLDGFVDAHYCANMEAVLLKRAQREIDADGIDRALPPDKPIVFQASLGVLQGLS